MLFQKGSTAGGLESIRHSSYLWAVPLTRRDSERLLGFVADAETISGAQPFTGELLVELGRLIEADWVTYTEVDPVHRRSLMYLPRPGDEDDETGDIEDEGWELFSAGFVFRETGQVSRDKLLASGRVNERRGAETAHLQLRERPDSNRRPPA